MQSSSRGHSKSIADQVVEGVGSKLSTIVKNARDVIGRFIAPRPKSPDTIVHPLHADNDLPDIDRSDEAALGDAVWFDVPGDGSCGLHAMLAYALFSWSMVNDKKSIPDDSILAVFNQAAKQTNARYVLESMRKNGCISDELLRSREYQAILEAFITQYKANQKRKILEAKHIKVLMEKTGIQDGKFPNGELYFEFDRHVDSLEKRKTADSGVWITSKDIQVLREVIHNETIPENDAITPEHRGQHWMLQIKRNSKLLDVAACTSSSLIRSTEIKRGQRINIQLQTEGAFDDAYKETLYFQSWKSKDGNITIRRAKQTGVTAYFEETDAKRAGQYAMQQYLAHQCPYTDEQLQAWSTNGELYDHITITGSDTFSQAAKEAISTYLSMGMQVGNVGHTGQLLKRHGLFEGKKTTKRVHAI